MKEISQPRSGIDRNRNQASDSVAEHDHRLQRVEADEAILALGDQQDTTPEIQPSK